jgi:hypothetical protein
VISRSSWLNMGAGLSSETSVDIYQIKKCHIPDDSNVCSPYDENLEVLQGKVAKRTVPTERPLLVGEVSANFLQILRSRVRFPALPDFLRSSGSGTGPTQLREDK